MTTRDTTASSPPSGPVVHGYSDHVTNLMRGLESHQSKLVCSYLLAVGEATPVELKEQLDLQLITVLPVLDNLVDTGVLDRDGDRYGLQLEEDDLFLPT